MATMIALSTVTISNNSTATINFTNIPQTYTDLVVKISARSNRTTAAYGTMNIQFNGSSSNFVYRHLMGYTSGVNSTTDTVGFPGMASTDFQTANTFGNAELYISNYTSSNNKSYSSDYVNENNSSSTEAAIMGLIAQSWSDTSPITSITLGFTSGFLFKQYSTATLYGVWAGPETLPTTPTIGTATATGATTATVGFTATSATGVDASYTALSSPGSITATGSSSPITVSGLTTGTAYTFQVRANNPGGSSAYSAASNSITPVQADYESIATVNLSSNQSTITFSSIPQTYKHLQLRITGRTTVASNQAEMALKVNGDSGIYTRHLLYGDGSSISVDGRAQGDDAFFMSWIAGNNAAANIQGVCIVDILDYTTSKTKAISVLTGLDRNGAGLVGIESSQINSGNAVSSISLITQPSGLNFMANSSFALYGIKG